jgi:putative nucleotidyltransferase with HDIG domain
MKQSLFHSVVARRIFLLFIACSLIPVSALMLVSLKQVYDYTRKENSQRLRQAAKSAGMSVHEGLYLLQSELRSRAYSLEGQKTPQPLESPHFVAVGMVKNNAIQMLSGPAVPTALLPIIEQLPRRDSNREAVLLKSTDAAGVHLYLLLGEAVTGGAVDVGIPIAEINQSFLWEFVAQAVPADMNLTILEKGGAWRTLFASAGEIPPESLVKQLESAVAATTSGQLQWGEGQEGTLKSFWTIFLEPTFSTGSWVVVASQSNQVLLKPMKLFVRTFALVTLLTVLVVTMVSVKQIRRSMGPLTALMEGTRKIGAGDLGTQITIASKDEFEELGGAFNAMSRNLAEHFDENKRLIAELQELNLGTIHALAKAVDAKSPWTAGHSERVTSLAVELGRILGVSPQELEDLKIGGLLHDIGKIGVYEALLDKPGKLTEEEFAQVREHPAKGAEILKPIKAYAAIIPMVEQHHECFDGSGYPHGLAGDQIAKNARIMAVADVFDALFSDRPYRKGWDIKEVMQHICLKAGSIFDPEVVAALTTLWDTKLSLMTPAEQNAYRGRC